MATGKLQQRMRKEIFVMGLFALLSFGSGSTLAARQSISNKKELNVALKSAKTGDDHRRIATYYERKAEELLKKEKEELALADYFARYPNMTGKIYPNLYQHHKDLADSYRRAKEIALQKAREHEEAAESLSASH